MRILQMIIITIVWGISPLYGNWEAFPALNFAMTYQYFYYGQKSAKIDTSTSNLKSLDKNYWYTYFSGKDWYTFSDFIDSNPHLGYGRFVALLTSHNSSTDANGGSQLVKKFELPQSIFDEGATKVKVSFDISRAAPVSFDVNVKPWNNTLSEPSSSDIGTFAETGSTIFNLYIVSLYTGDIIYSQEGNGVTWNHSGVMFETLSVSFLLDGRNLYANSDGYALVVESFYEGTAATTQREFYLAHSFKFEYLIEETIPEPATTGFALLGLGSLLIRRRK